MGHCARVNGMCKRCEGELPFAFTMAFQPIVDIASARTVAYEALVRGPQGESAWSVISRVTDDLLYRFDQACRVKAIALASELDMRTPLSINFLPNAVYEPEACIQATLDISHQVGWPPEQLIFEITETEKVRDREHLASIIEVYRAMGFQTALDDFGSGYANFDLLTILAPDRLKVDRQLVMNCDSDPRRQALLKALVPLAKELSTTLIAEGVETHEEALWLARAGITCQQGFYFARPQIGTLGPNLSERLLGLRGEV
ncbi:EAL domain-containing protein [Halomonas dongshanensis]|uniref:EAL domain-containing protein n=1 Tax=Halomonas dongshanensis TaxID=2890835 RepID=A0ABT2E9Z6_9GAMM|nr:EAL domain-containing protein [Halomonas dongshanensis]MCS2608402.1 EAL domain-containing protein [Halomonas dongshanensis]